MPQTPQTPQTAERQPRRSQAERSATTRQALLDATIQCLVEEGYEKTTTSRVAEIAGVSRGAHLHHFQTRTALVTAAMEHLAQRRAEGVLAATEELPPGREGLEQGLDVIWATYADPLFQGALSLWTVARTDSDLREHLIEIERALDRQTLEFSRRLFPEHVDRPDFERLVEMANAAARGLCLLDTLHPDGERNRLQWPSARAMLVELFTRDSTAPTG